MWVLAMVAVLERADTIRTHISRRDLARITSPLDRVAETLLEKSNEERDGHTARVRNSRSSD